MKINITKNIYKPFWKNHKLWVCPNHLPPIVYYYTLERCCAGNCKSVRPTFEDKERQEAIKSIIIAEEDRCGYYKCSKKKIEGRLYCSHECRKKRARRLYALKKLVEKHKKRNDLEKIVSLKQEIEDVVNNKKY